MDIEIYTFEDRPGNEFGSWHTRDIKEARAYAQAHNLRIIANTYVFEDSKLVEDYTVAEFDDSNVETHDCDECGMPWEECECPPETEE